jgi:hypothetical protein
MNKPVMFFAGVYEIGHGKGFFIMTLSYLHVVYLHHMHPPFLFLTFPAPSTFLTAMILGSKVSGYS